MLKCPTSSLGVERRTRQRSALEEMLGRTTGFRSAPQLHAMLREDGDAVSLATVYRLLQSMAGEGEVDVLPARTVRTGTAAATARNVTPTGFAASAAHR